MYLQYVVRSRKLTLAGRHAIKPLVINIFVAGTSTILKPSATRSAATDSARSLERAALGTRHRLSDRWGNGWRGDCNGDRRPNY